MSPLQPVGPASAYQTYALRAPLSTHFRKATCREVNCPAYLNGWRTIVGTGSVQAQYIRAKSERVFTEHPQDGGMVEFRFPPGQMCFRAAEHRAPLHREPLYIVRDGDHRGNPTGRRRQHRNGADWVDDFGEHQQRLTDQREKG